MSLSSQIRAFLYNRIMKTPQDITPNYRKAVFIKTGPWDQQIVALEQFFKEAKLPNTLSLDKCSQITDIRLFVRSHLSILRGQNGNERYLPYMDRLYLLKGRIEDEKVNIEVKNDAVLCQK